MGCNEPPGIHARVNTLVTADHQSIPRARIQCRLTPVGHRSKLCEKRPLNVRNCTLQAGKSAYYDVHSTLWRASANHNQ